MRFWEDQGRPDPLELLPSELARFFSQSRSQALRADWRPSSDQRVGVRGPFFCGESEARGEVRSGLPQALAAAILGSISFPHQPIRIVGEAIDSSMVRLLVTVVEALCNRNPHPLKCYIPHLHRGREESWRTTDQS